METYCGCTGTRWGEDLGRVRLPLSVDFIFSHSDMDGNSMEDIDWAVCIKAERGFIIIDKRISKDYGKQKFKSSDFVGLRSSP